MKYFYLLSILILLGTLSISGCNVHVEKHIDLSNIPIEKISLYKGVGTVVPQYPLRMSYKGMKDSNYILEVEHTEDGSCDKKEILLLKGTSAYYTCNEENYLFKLDTSKSNSDSITFSVESN